MATVSVLGRKRRQISRFPAALCVVIDTRRGKLFGPPGHQPRPPGNVAAPILLTSERVTHGLAQWLSY